MAWWGALLGAMGSSGMGQNMMSQSGSTTGGVAGAGIGTVLGGIMGANRAQAKNRAIERQALMNAYAPYYNRQLQDTGPKSDEFAKGILIGAQKGWKMGANIGGMFQKKGNDPSIDPVATHEGLDYDYYSPQKGIHQIGPEMTPASPYGNIYTA